MTQPGGSGSETFLIAIQNVSDPDPPAWVTFLLGTHPPTIERIGQAARAAKASSRD